MYQSELEDFERELEWHNRFLEAAGVTDLIFVTDQGTDDIGVYSMSKREVRLFSDFRDAEQYCVSSFPDAYWETTGWKKD